jgi:hypothetical protein
MSQELTLLPAGWIPDPNPHSAAPPGAATVSDNVIIPRRGVIQPRPGFPSTQSWTAGSVGTYIIGYESGEYMWEAIAAGYSCTSLVRVSDGANVFKDASTGVGNALTVTVGSASSVEARKNLYLTTKDGLRRIESIAGAAGIVAKLSGVPAGLTPLVTVKVAAGHWFKADSQVAYRIVFQKTINGFPLQGAPSGHIVVTNPAAGADGLVELDIPIPVSTTGSRGGLGVVAGDRVAVYRTTQTHVAAGGGESIDPGDEMQTVADLELTAAQVTAGRLVVQDYIEDVNLGPFLYTNSTAEGILQENTRPPVSSDIVDYAGSVYFGNCQVPAQQSIDIVDPEAMATLTLTSAELTAGSTTVVNFAPWVVSEDHVGRFLGAVQNAGIGAWSGDPANGGVYLDKFTQIIAADVGTNTYTISKAALASTAGGANSNIDAHSFIAVACQGQIDDGLAQAYERDIYFSSSAQNPQSIALQIFDVDAASALKTAQALSAISSQNSNRYFNIFAVGDEVQASLLIRERTPLYAASGGDATECEVYGYAKTADASGLSPSPPRIVPDPFVLGSGLTFDTNIFINRVYFSKQSVPEAVPFTNFFDVGSSSFPVQRMIRTRESLFIFKEDGIFRLTATSPFDQRLDLVDPTYSLVHPDAACMLDNKVFAWTNQGVILASDSGIASISANVIQTELDAAQDALVAITPLGKPFAFSDESGDTAYLGIPSISASLAWCTEMFVFCGRTQTWSKYSFTDRYLRDGNKKFKDSASKLTGSTTSPTSSVYTETPLPYDQAIAVTVTAVTDTTVDIAAASGWTPTVGDVVQVGATAKIVTSVVNALKFVVESSGLGLGAGTAYVGFSSQVQFIVKEAQNPGKLKHWLYVTPIFSAMQDIVSFDATFETNQDPSPATLNAVVPYNATSQSRLVRLTPTRQHSRAAELFIKFSFRTAHAVWQLQGMSLTYIAGSTRVQR